MKHNWLLLNTRKLAKIFQMIQTVTRPITHSMSNKDLITKTREENWGKSVSKKQVSGT